MTLRKLFEQVDKGFLGCLIALMLLGLYNLSSAGKPLGQSLHVTHGVHVMVGMVVALMMVSVPYRHLEGLAYPILIIVLILLVSTTAFGRVVNGSRRWLSLGPLTLQTSDFAKIATVIIIARTFHLDSWENGGLYLRDIFRPMNISRPAVLLFAVLALSLFGELIRPPKIERWGRSRYHPALTLRHSVSHVALGGDKRVNTEIGHRSLLVRHRGVKADHASLERTLEGWMLHPLPQRDIFLNDTLVTDSKRLEHGDIIQLGPSPSARLKYSNNLATARRFMPWLALFGVIWLMLALHIQLHRGFWLFRDIVAPIDVVLAPCLLILGQPDLGTTLVIMLIAFSMVLYVGLQPRSLLTMIGGSLGFGALAWGFILESYQKERLRTFINPEGDLAGAGYHQNQSLIAIGSGEMFGKGHGQGTQTQLSFLPEQQTDFIFSVWAEEHGFVGGMLVVVLFVGLLLTSLRIAQRARDRFGALLVIGVTSMLFWHSIVNMLMVLRLAPVVGVPLPLWSNGGSFVLTTMIGVGLILNVSARRTMF
ncbi:MAG: rod shape-determining protein RodA [Myxococcales bacterium]|nr:rod shape-determining protein RodA [Myxococcales bacterium]